jgi:poly-gamma-glutamate synthesis protein (capsule biosynthesis protein)
VVALLLVFGLVFGIWYLVFGISDDGFVKTDSNVLERSGSSEYTGSGYASSNIFTLENIDGIEQVERAAQALSVPAKNPFASAVSTALLPHHTLVAEPLGDFWTEIAEATSPSVIVLVSPAHLNQGQAVLQTTRGTWQTSVGKVQTDDAIVSRLVSLEVVDEEPKSFKNEHGIGVQVAYIARLFPEARIVPVIAKSSAGEEEARSLVLTLDQLLPEDALVVASVDFAHELDEATSRSHDAETLGHMAARRYDRIDALSSEYVDTPFGVDAYLLWSDRQGVTPEFVWEGTSHTLLGDPAQPGTSYLIFLSYISAAVGRGTEIPPITLTAVGDMMLGRAVATALTKTTIQEAFSDARTVLSGSDLVFGNLESVLTNSTASTGKSIYFKGDPVVGVPALHEMGFTHLSVANNHVDDYALAGWQDSVATLLAGSFSPIGDYRNNVTPVVTDVRGKKYVFLAYEDLLRAKSKEEVVADVREAETLGDVLVVSVHWGAEYTHTPSRRQTDLAHAIVDAGADIVLGHHPHVLQPVELYNGGFIAYSLGNFIFDQIGADQNESLAIHLTWNDDGTRTATFDPLRIRGSFPRAATADERAATLSRLAKWSDASLTQALTKGELTWE